MFGFIIAFMVAIFAAMHDSFINASSKKGDEYVTALAMTLFSFPIIIVILYWIGFPEVNKFFWIAFLIKVPLMSCAGIFRAKAHKAADQSLIVPMLCFTPVFVLMLAPIFLGQTIKPLGILGVIVLIAGAYLLRIKEKGVGFFQPFQALYREIGVRYMLLVSFIWGITTVLDGIGVINAGASKTNLLLSFRAGAFWLLCTQAASSLIVATIILLRWKKNVGGKIEIKKIIPIGFSSFFQDLFQMCAMGLIAAAYVNSIKRLSIIFSIIIGRYIFKESGLRERLIGAIVMILGFILITFSK